MHPTRRGKEADYLEGSFRVLNQAEIDSLLGFDPNEPDDRSKRVPWKYAALHLIAELKGAPLLSIWDTVALRQLELQARVDAGEAIDFEEPFCD